MSDTTQRSQWFQILSDWTQWLTNVVVAASAFAAAYQYYQSQADTRLERTLQMVQRFDGDYTSARERVDDLAARVRDALQSAEPALSGLSSPERTDLRRRVVLSVVYGGRHDPPAGLVEVAGFFATMQSCIDQNACDPQTAKSFLGEYATSFWHDFGEVVQFERSHSRKTFAKGLERFVGQGSTT